MAKEIGKGIDYMAKKATIERSSGNVYADLGVKNPDEYNVRAQLAYRICAILEEKRLTQRGAAKLLQVDQPKISALMNGLLDGFSSDRLFRFLSALDHDVEIIIKPKRSRRCRGKIKVSKVS